MEFFFFVGMVDNIKCCQVIYTSVSLEIQMGVYVHGSVSC
jgi:hypothetical protein